MLAEIRSNTYSFPEWVDLAHDFDTILNLLKVNKKFYSCARLALYRMPVICTTFNWAVFSIHCVRHKDLAIQLLSLNFGSNRPNHRLKLPYMDHYSDGYGKVLHFSKPFAPFPFSSMLHYPKSIYKELPALPRYPHFIDEKTFLNIKKDIKALIAIFPFDKFDQLMSYFLDGFLKNDSNSYSCLKSIVEIIMRYETYFCSVELYYDNLSLDISIWRTLSSIQHFFVPHLFNQIFEQELCSLVETSPRKILNSKESQAYLILRLICNIVNKFFYGNRFNDDENDDSNSTFDDHSTVIVYGSSLLELTKSTPFLQSLSLSNTTLVNDTLYKETGEYESMISHDMPVYYTRIPISPIESLTLVFQNCSRLKYIDFSKCVWVKRQIVELIVKKSPPSLVSVNFTFCTNLSPSCLAKLFVFDSHRELVFVLKDELMLSSVQGYD